MDFELTFAQSDWWEQLVANAPSETYIEASFRFSGHTYSGVGVRFKGNSSQRVPGLKKPFKIDFNRFHSGQRFFGMDNINLANSFKDPTMMREVIFSDIAGELGLPVVRYAYANLRINGRLWGLYVIQEQIDDIFLERYFGNDSGNLFKAIRSGTLSYEGAAQSAYVGEYELQTNEAEDDWTDLIALCRALDQTASQNFATSVGSVLDLNAALGHLALNNVFASLDSYIGSVHNYYIYHEQSTGRFVMIFWDLNEAFGTFKSGFTDQQIIQMSPYLRRTPRWPEDLALTRAYGVAEGCRPIYDAWMRRIVNGPFAEQGIKARIDKLHALIGPHVQADPNKLFSYMDYLKNQTQDVLQGGGGTQPALTIFGLTRFVRDRRAFLHPLFGSSAASPSWNRYE